MGAAAENALEVAGLTVVFPGRERARTVVDQVAFALKRGEILGVVGESGAGKSTLGAAITQLLDCPGYIAGGSVRLGREELIGKSEHEMRRVRGRRIGTVFQDPSTALCPVLSIGTQLVRAIRLNRRMPERQAR